MTDAESQAAIRQAAEDVDYWYQVAQALCLRLAQKHMPYGEVDKLVAEVELDAATDFEDLLKLRRGLYSSVCLEMFEGLRTIRERKRQGEG